MLIILWWIISKYTDLYSLILNTFEEINCIDNEDTLSPCKKLLGLSGKVLFLFSFVTIALLIFKKEKEIIIKMLFIYFSAATILYTTGIGYTDIEGQKLQLKLNHEYHKAQKEMQLLDMYINYENEIENEKNEIKFQNNLKIEELRLSIKNSEIFYKVLRNEAKLYLQYRVTAAYAIICMTYVLLIILFLQIKINRLTTIAISLLLFLLVYPST